MIVAVLDTNIWISSFITLTGPPGQLRRHYWPKRFDVGMSQLLLEEIDEVLRRKIKGGKIKVREEEIEQFVGALRNNTVFRRDILLSPVVLADPDDDIIIATAVAASADYIVSGDSHLLDLREYKGIKIRTPREFIDIIDGIAAPG